MEVKKLTGKRLGRLRPEHPPHLDPRVLHLSDYIDEKKLAARKAGALPAIKPYRDWSAWAATQLGGADKFGAMLNESLGDCTCAAIGHAIQVLTAVAGTIVTPTDDQVLAMYEQSGYVPGNPSTDNGWMIQSALQYWKTTGLAGHKCDAFLAVNPQNMTHVDFAFETFGLVDIGVMLPISAQNQSMLWSVPQGGFTADDEPGSWGGHSVIVTKRAVTSPITPGTVLRHGLITWGQADWRITPAFWRLCVDECWVAFSTDFLKKNDLTDTGLNQAQLLADLKAVAN